MRKIVLIYLFCCSLFLPAQSQTTYTLPELIAKAEAYYPFLKQKENIIAIGQETDKVLKESLIPSLNVVGKATYQSEVTKFENPTGLLNLPYDNYDLGLDLRIPLTEFGNINARKELEYAKTDLALNQLDVENQRLRERITNIYGNLLLQQENKKVLTLREETLAAQEKKIAVSVKNGYLLKSNQLVLESEILTTDQRIIEINATVTNLLKELSILTGMAIDAESTFELPTDIALQTNINRPEQKVFDSQISVLTNQIQVLKRDNLPKLFVFGTGAYGRPGYNFLDVDLRWYGIVGAGVNYNLNNLFTQKNKITSADLNIGSLQRQKETFNMNLEISMAQKQTEIEKYETIIAKDKEIVLKRQEILKEYASQLDNGAITSTEYLTELNATNNAELNLLLHSVQKNITETQYNLLTGN